MATPINQYTKQTLSTSVNPNTGKSDYQVYNDAQGAVDQARAMAAEPTVSDTYKSISAPTSDTAAYDTAADEIGNYYLKQFNDPVDKKSIYRNTLKQYQAQIDATNKIYADQLRSAQVEGQGRLGSQTAISARSGTLGSDFGSAKTDQVQNYNRGIEGDIRNAHSAKIAEIMGLVRKGAADETNAKAFAKKQGADEYLKHLSGKTERRQAGISKTVQALVSQGVDPSQLDPKELESIASQLGTTVDDLKAAYFDAKKAYDATEAKNLLDTQKTQAEINKLNDKSFTLSEGQSQYDANGNVIASKGKTYAPTSASSSGLNPYQTFQATQSLKKTTQANTSAARELTRQGSILDATWNRYTSGEAKDLNATTQAIVTTFNKILDPDSVVRETEYDRSASGQALLSTIEGKIAAISQGGPGLTPQSLQELVNLGKKYTSNAQKSIETANSRAREEAQFFGINPEFVTTAEGAGNTDTSTSGLSDDQAYQEYLNQLNGSN